MFSSSSSTTSSTTDSLDRTNESPDDQTPLLWRDAERHYGEGGAARTPNDAERQGKQQQEADSIIKEEPSTTKVSLIAGCVFFGSFFAALDSTIVATLAGPIASSFESGKHLSWLASAYLIGNVTVQPIAGKLTDIFGRRAGLAFANVSFCLGTLICGLARSQTTMIVGRVIAGLGGGCLNSISVFIISDLVPLRNRGVYQGVANIVYSIGSSTGGIFGGAINDHFTWRWAFLIQIPFILISGTTSFLVVKLAPTNHSNANIARWKRIDFGGIFLLVSSLVLLLLGLNSGGNIVPWSHPLVTASIPVSTVLFIIFLYVEARLAPEPVLPLPLLLNRTVACACLANLFLPMSRFAVLYFVPLYYQAHGSTSTAAGTRLVPDALGSSLGSLLAGLAMRRTGRYQLLNRVSAATYVLATASLAALLWKPETPSWPVYPAMLASGLGFGAGLLTVQLLAIVSAVPHDQQALATSAAYACRALGSTLGIAFAGAVFQNGLVAALRARFTGPGAEKAIGRIRDGIVDGGGIRWVPKGWEEGVVQCFERALRGVWTLMVVLGVLGMGVGLGIRQHRLYATIDRQ